MSTDKRTDLQRSLEEFALSFPEAWSDTPWDGDQVTKVRKKISRSTEPRSHRG